MSLGLGVSGMPFNGSDIGGFMESPSQELYIRWLPVSYTHLTLPTSDLV